jgi:hypothetical protein
MKYIIVAGNPVDGLEFIGPFDTFDDAQNAINTDALLPDYFDWWIAKIEEYESPE